MCVRDKPSLPLPTSEDVVVDDVPVAPLQQKQRTPLRAANVTSSPSRRAAVEQPERLPRSNLGAHKGTFHASGDNDEGETDEQAFSGRRRRSSPDSYQSSSSDSDESEGEAVEQAPSALAKIVTRARLSKAFSSRRRRSSPGSHKSSSSDSDEGEGEAVEQAFSGGRRRSSPGSSDSDRSDEETAGRAFANRKQRVEMESGDDSSGSG